MGIAQLFGQTLAEANQGSLAGAVSGIKRTRVGGAAPGKMDDFAPGLGQHGRQHRLRKVETPDQIGLNCCYPLFSGDSGSRTHWAEHAGAVHQAMDCAKAVHDFLYQLLNLFAGTYVERKLQKFVLLPVCIAG
jgi:hypothetical protein